MRLLLFMFTDVVLLLLHGNNLNNSFLNIFGLHQYASEFYEFRKFH